MGGNEGVERVERVERGVTYDYEDNQTEYY